MKISPTPVLDLKLIHPASPFSQTSRRLAAHSLAVRLAAIGARLVYVLGEVRKAIEAEIIEARIAQLEAAYGITHQATVEPT